MINQRLFIALIVAFSIAVAYNTAHANRIWTSIGGGCVPVDEDVQVNNYDSRGFGVGFKGVATGDIRLLCSITVPAGSFFRKFIMSYKDPDGTGTQARIRAWLRSVNDASNQSFPVCTADSNTSAVTVNTLITCDHSNFPSGVFESLYFEVLIERTSTNQDPEFLAIAVLDND